MGEPAGGGIRSGLARSRSRTDQCRGGRLVPTPASRDRLLKAVSAECTGGLVRHLRPSRRSCFVALGSCLALRGLAVRRSCAVSVSFTPPIRSIHGADLWLHRVFLIEAQPPLPRLATAPQLSPSIHVRLSGCPLVPLADFPALASNGIKARAASSDPVATFS